MNKTDKLKLVNAAFQSMQWAFDSCMVNHADTLLDMCKGEEKSHRGWGSDFDKYHPDAPSVTQCAKIFAVKRVAEYLNGAKEPGGMDFLHVQKSCFQASAMVAEYGQQILNEWDKLYPDITSAQFMRELAALDYTEFVKAQAPREAVTA